MIRRLFFISIFLTALAGHLSAQDNTDQQLAAYYFQNGEFEKALMYYEKLYENSPVTYYYENYFKCLTELKKFEEAEKLARKHLKKDGRNLTIHLDIADMLIAQGNTKGAQEEYEKAMKSLQPDYSQIYRLAEAFSERGMHDNALSTYEKGGKLLRDNYRFAELEAVIYARKGQYTEMFRRLFDLLEIFPDRLPSVEAYVTSLVDFEKENNPQVETLRIELLRRVQKDPNNDAFSELLTWYYEQKGDFNGAFNQVKGVDKRMGYNGRKVYDFAWMCINNNQLDIAAKAFEYVAEMGRSSIYYLQARKGLLDVLYRKIVELGIYTPDDVTQLLAQYDRMLNEMGRDETTTDVIRQEAHVLAFHAHQPDSAIHSLERALAYPGVTMVNQAELKMEMAGIMVLQGNIWEAALYYGQVEKAFKHDVLGHEAKFRLARIYYYSGDFEWSQAQLSVLKSSTSKLIANDAMDLSLLITENIGLDSIREPLQLYSRADFYYAQHAYDNAMLTLDTLVKRFPFHSLGDDALFLRFKIEKSRGNMDNAKKYLDDLVTGFPRDLLADDAVFNLAELYHYHYVDLDKAAELYKKILFEYPGSLYNVAARKRYRALRGETQFKE